MAKEIYIGVDVGGTLMRAARITPDLQIEERKEVASRARDSQAIVVQQMIDLAKSVFPTDGTKVGGIGISLAGPVNPTTGVMIRLTNFDDFQHVPLRDMFQEQLKVATFLGNDANVAALAETELGAARGYSDVLFLTISTGIGGGVIAGGKMLVGSEGLGAECGHIVMLVEGERVSSLEKEAAGPGLARQAREAIQAGKSSKILELAGGKIEAITGKSVGQAAQAGDALALHIVQRAGKIIGLGIVSFLNIFNPQIVVIGGSVAKGTWNLIEGPMWDAIRQYALDAEYWNHLVITQAALGENVSLIGAGALALRAGAQ